jgi:succinate dehydrogenase / fumarate reductase cytochrome b subunit
MNILSGLFRSSLGRKYLLAVTGLLLFLFVLAHLAGNLQIFLGPEAINRYGHFLQSNPELIWPARLVLLLTLVVHVWAAIQLSIENKAARPIAYAQWKPVGSTYASRTMLMSGLIIFAFVIYHLLHFTVQAKYVNLTGEDFGKFTDNLQRHDIYTMMVIGFRSIWVSGFYILGMALLCLHLSHGVSSMFQSLGWKNQTYGPALDKLARGAALAIFFGYISIPVAILLGYGSAYPGVAARIHHL